MEFRLASKADSTSRWSWIAGAFYSQERQHTEFDSYVNGYSETPSFEYYSEYEANLTGNELPGTDRWFLGRYDTELDQKAVFGELSFDVTENFRITAGGRWFDYDRGIAQIQEQPEGFSGASRLDSASNTSEDGSAIKLNLRYQLSAENLVYGTYSEGFRIGGNNTLKPASLLPRAFDSDKLKNFEVGTKNEWLNNRLRFNLSAYYMQWQDFAVQVEDPQPVVFQLGFVNLPSADIQGVEAEFAFQASSAWTIEGSFSYNDAKTAEASTLTVTDEGGEEFSFAVRERRAPAAVAEVERCGGSRVPSAGELGRRRALRAFRLLVRRVFGELARGHRIGSERQSADGTARLRSRQPALRSRKREMDRFAVLEQRVGRTSRAVHQQSLEGPAHLGESTGQHRLDGGFQVLTAP